MKSALIGLGLAVVIILLSFGTVVLLRNRTSTADEDSFLETQTQNQENQEGLPFVKIISDSVEIKLPSSNSFVTAKSNDQIKIGTIVRTNGTGRAQIVFPNKSVTTIDTNSQVTLQKFETEPNVAKIQIDEGRIWNRVAKLLGKEDVFESETQSLVASVRGTSYGHGILADGRNKISVSRNSVEVKCFDSKLKPVSVDFEKQVVTNCQTQPKALAWEKADLTDEWFLFNKKADLEYFKDPIIPNIPKATPTPSPKPTPTLVAIPSPSITPTPTPFVYTVTSANCGNYCYSKPVLISIMGDKFETGAKVFLNNPQDQTPIYDNGVTINSARYITARFDQTLSGNYDVWVELHGTKIKSPNFVTNNNNVVF